MKNLSLLLIGFLFLNSKMKCQMKSVSFSDGSKMDYEMIENNTDNAKKSFIKIGLPIIGYEYSHPKKFSLSFGYAYMPYFQATIPFIAKDVEKPTTLQLAAKRGTIFIVRGENVVYTTAHGLHVGGFYVPNYANSYTSACLMFGYGKYTTSHAKYFVDDKKSGKREKISFTKKRSFAVDMIYALNYTPQTIYGDASTDPNTGISTPNTTYEYSKVGILFNFEGIGTTAYKSKKNETGYCTKLSFGIGPRQTTNMSPDYGIVDYLVLMFGWGFCF